ncbi:MAG: DUF3179 domain-containing protein [Gammaproteobacteria bacterium]|nr:DUF3179 domain-containing protein [Gammaproteobacteria bacterium]
MAVSARDLNGFKIDPEAALIPIDEIHSGGPPRDGIPSIDNPSFEKGGMTKELKPEEQVLGLVHNGVARAYPVAIMNWHEIVNDRFGREPVVITFCPLCGSGVAYRAELSGEVLEFGVSGLLYNSDVLLYDRQTESLWSQILSRAVTGKMRGRSLSMLPLEHTTWESWLSAHPDTEVLSRNTGSARDYDRDPYAGYQSSRGIYFPVKKRDPRFHPKERVLGIEIEGQYKAYPLSELSLTEGMIVNDEFAGEIIRVIYDPKGQSARLVDDAGKTLPAIQSFWFAWYAFHPDTAVFRAPER